MITLFQHRGWKACLALALALVFSFPAVAGEFLLWEKSQERVTANVQTWDVLPVLKRVAASTGWNVYLQPNTKQVVPTRFQGLSEGEALRRLLGNLNFVLVPQSNAPARLYVFRTSRREATELIRAPEKAAQAKPIQDELIVILKPGEKIDELAQRLGAKVVGQLKDLNAYRLKFKDAASTQQAREALANEPSVASVDNNYNVARPPDPGSIGLMSLPFDLNPKAPADGKYFIVGLIDSGVQPDAGRFGQFLLDSISVGNGSTLPSGEPTHGTSMAETILNGMTSVLGPGADTSVRILNVDVYGNNPTSSTFDVAEGISRAIQAGAKIINLSMGSDGDSWVLHQVIRSAYDQNIPVFAAAGNEPVATPTFPAAYPEVVGVTARDPSGNIASYANFGDFVKAAGPGGTFVAFGDQTYYVTGTSASTAWLSGEAAALAESTKQPINNVVTAVQMANPVKRPVAGQ